jgi:WD40 repeat protein
MYGEFMDFISDAHRFIGAFGYPIAQSAPHIYISALPFAPEHSSVARRFLPQFPQILALSTGKPTDWPPCVFTSEHHLDDVNSIAFSPDEKFFVSGSSDETICTCDSETGNLISGPFRGTDWVASSFFDPDGRRVWASHLDGQVIGWDVETGDENVRFQAGGYFDVIGCRCFNSGRNVVSVSQEQGTVTLWNADTGERLRILVRTPTSGRSKVSFSPDGCYMAWAGNLNTAVRIWKLVEGGEIRGSSHSQPQLGHTQPISALSFSVDGHFVVSGSLDGTILVWDAETGDVVGDPLAPSKGKVRAVAYSHQNRVLVSASGMSGTIMVCNAATHEIVLGPLEGHTSDIMAIALSRDGRRALSASGDATVRMWDLSRNAVVPTTHANKGHTGWVRCVVFSPCGRKLTSVGIDETIRVWDASTGECFLGPIESLSHYERIIFSPDGSQIVAFGSTDGAIGAWNVNTGELAFEHDLSDDNYKDTGIEHVAFRSTDQRLVTCSSNGVVRIWSLEDGFLTEDLSVSSPWPEDDNEPVEILALSPDGLTAIVSDMNRNPRHYLWSTTTCQPLPLTFPHDELNSGDPVAFSPSGRFFAAASSNDDVTTLRIWNTRTGEQVVGPLWLNGELECLAFSPDDCHIAFCYFHFRSHAVTNSIWILDVHTGHLTSGPWKGHSDYVRVLAFPPDGDKLASGSIGGQIGIWNATDLLGHTQASSGVGTCMQDGWVMDASGDILFWVPKDHRSNLVWSHNIMVIGGSGIRTELDLGRFRYGRNWVKCLADRK